MPFDGTHEAPREHVLKCLRAGRDLVARPGGWTQGVNDFPGKIYLAEGAIYDGLVGLFDEISKDHRGPVHDAALGHLFAVIPSWFIEEEKQKREKCYCHGVSCCKQDMADRYNNVAGRTQEQVLDWFDTAIAHCEGKLG